MILRLTREERPQNKSLPPKLEREEITVSWSRDPLAETSLGRFNCNLEIAGSSVWPSLRDKNSKGTKLKQNIRVLVSLVFVDPGKHVCSPRLLFGCWVVGFWLSGESGQFRHKLLLFSNVPSV